MSLLSKPLSFMLLLFTSQITFSSPQSHCNLGWHWMFSSSLYTASFHQHSNYPCQLRHTSSLAHLIKDHITFACTPHYTCTPPLVFWCQHTYLLTTRQPLLSLIHVMLVP
uniref:Secreted protein n=1 Tax=Octopus bimaculoides TaxID=37653 RepID=A0A0L8HQ49_OCTBM